MGYKNNKRKLKQKQQEKQASPEQKEKHNPPLENEEDLKKKRVAAELREVKLTVGQQQLAELEKMLEATKLEEKLEAAELAELAAELAEQEKQAAAELAEKEKQAAAELAEKEKQAAAVLAEKEKQAAESRLPQQVITSQKEVRDAFALQQKIVAAIINSQAEIATKEDLESLQDVVRGRLEALGKTLVADVASEIQKELISSSMQLSQKAEKIISSKVKGALQKLDTAFKEKVETECAKVAPGPKERMALHLVEREYEECFSIAVESDKDSLGWLLTKVDPEGLPGFQLSKPTLRHLLSRLIRLVTKNMGLYRSWFEAVAEFVVSTDHEIPDRLTRMVGVAQAYVSKNA